ncbi:U5 putative protein [Bangoran virus]|uniref:U5 putative protein n=1 Tax=Bangoran virus TaxID=864693 RepID=UPI002481FB8E|nr:U5 putative protein [Bangoran virus]UAX43322.1 U5 putative protein [Bangoran virus]
MISASCELITSEPLTFEELFDLLGEKLRFINIPIDIIPWFEINFSLSQSTSIEKSSKGFIVKYQFGFNCSTLNQFGRIKNHIILQSRPKKPIFIKDFIVTSYSCT